MPGEYLVKFRAPTTRAYAASALSAARLEVKRTFVSVPGLHHVIAAPGVNADLAAAQLARDPSVEYVEPNFLVHAAAVPNDPLFPKQWALNNTGQLTGTTTPGPDIGALAAWNITTGSASIVIAVIDSGVDYNHVDLAANMWVNPSECNNNGLDNDGDGYVNDCHGVNTITHTGDPMDDDFHGTHVAGTIAAGGNNAVGITGINWASSILACKFLDSTGNGTDADAIACLDYVALMKDRGVNIVASNNSWGADPYSQALHDAIVAQRTRGILFVTAAGNGSGIGTDNEQIPFYPCSYDLSNVICVASAIDSISLFSNYGLGTVHLAAPGESVLSTVLNDQYATYDGTSMATAHVTGVIGLLKAQDPTRDWRALKNLVLAGAVPPTQGKIPTLTGGRLYAPNSMNCTNSVVEARMRPAIFETITLPVGASLPLEAININCANPNGNVVVTVAPTGETVTLVDDGTGNDEVAGDGIYSGAWIASAPGTYTLTFPGRAGDVVNVEVDSMLRPGFPLSMDVWPDPDGVVRPPLVSLVVGDIDGDSQPEILAAGYGSGPLYAWKSNGAALPGWPNYNVAVTSEVSLGKFNATATGLGVAAAVWLDGLRLYNGDASPIAGWPQSSTLLYFPPPTVDLDGDGIDEIIGWPARRADGTVFNPTVSIPPAEAASSNITSSVAVADLDADGKPDMVVADGQSVWATNAQGVLAGFPVPSPGTSSVFINPVIGDVNGDGRPEIILPTVTYSGGTPYLTINVLTNEGVPIRAWTTPDSETSGIVALADLDGDGIPEIIASAGTNVYAWKGDGTLLPGWPASLGTGNYGGPVAVGDVTGDGYPDVVLVSYTLLTPSNPTPNGHVHAFDRLGNPLPGFPKALHSSLTATTPAIADLDGTGHNILIVNQAPDLGTRPAIFAYDLHGTGTYGPIEWGQYMGGSDHRGYYETGKNLPNDVFLTAQAHGAGTIASSDGGINCGTACIHLYPKGSSVQLTAAAAPGATFASWLGPCAGQANPCTVSVTRYTPVAADFTTPVTVTVSGSGSVISTPAGINCPAAACSATFPARTSISLTATAASGDAFNGWGGDCSGTVGFCTLTINAAKSVSAQFVDHRTLTVGFSGSGTARVLSSPAGIDCGSTCMAPFPPGSVVTLTSTPASDTYVANWGFPGCLNYGNTCAVTLSTDVSGVVALALKPTLSLTFSGAGSVVLSNDGTSVTCTSACTQPMDPGSSAFLTATGASSTYFSGWGGNCTGTLNVCDLLMTTSQTVSVNFAPKLQVSVAVTGTGQGSVVSSDGMLNCPSTCVDAVAGGAVLTLTANPSSGSTFSGWSGACSGSQPSCSLTVNAGTSVGASFAATSGSGTGGSGGSSGGTSGGHSGGGGALDLLSLAALVGLAVRRRLPRRAAIDCTILRQSAGTEGGLSCGGVSGLWGRSITVGEGTGPSISLPLAGTRVPRFPEPSFVPVCARCRRKDTEASERCGRRATVHLMCPLYSGLPHHMSAVRPPLESRPLAVSAAGAVGVLLIHALLVLLFVLSLSTSPRRPATAGVGATALVSATEPEMTVVFIDEPTPAENTPTSKPPALASRGMTPPDLQLVVLSPDPSPAAATVKTADSNDAEEDTASADAAEHARLYGRYLGQVQARVERAWMRPRSEIGAPQFSCRVRIQQDRRGSVIGIQLDHCNGTERWQQSLLSAIRSASPLPAPPDPSVYADRLWLNFASGAFENGGSAEGFEPEARQTLAAANQSQERERLEHLVVRMGGVFQSSPKEHSGIIHLTIIGSPNGRGPPAESASPLGRESAPDARPSFTSPH